EIQRAIPTDWREMFRVYNMGVRLEIYAPASEKDKIFAVAEQFGVRAYEIGRVEDGNPSLTIEYAGKQYVYEKSTG
ncbi:MAG: AIR synthase-related protein, partial [Bacteroidia bacterium]|nr:AIR synthase-related protein [Bacteroidia bacterium]